MGKRLSSGLILLLGLCLALSWSQNKREKAYELIYKDVQQLKQQVLALDAKIEQNAEEIKGIRDQLKELLDLTRQFQSAQASIREEQRRLPAQYQILLEKVETINMQLAQFSEDLIEIKRGALPLAEQVTEEENPEEDRAEPPPPQEQEDAGDRPEDQPSISPNLSPNEVYNMARSDYLKGNFELAIEGFTIYSSQFPESPLADDALYWIGECYFSQDKYDEAIEHFNELILNYPTGDKIPAAYLKKGISLTAQNKKEEALSVFKLLITKFPLEEETKIAQQKIRELETNNERHQQPE
ncbi:MAG: tol-pal system protein YbgF [Candidatus Aminicenantes bacterium]|jgi:tol-pal system protein YbgF